MTDTETKLPGASQDRSNFEKWYGNQLERLISDSAAGFVCTMVAFPLLERHLRRTSNSEPRAEPFLNALLDFLPELQTIDNANKFWWGYRHGLLHTAELKRSGDWLSHQTEIVLLQGGSMWLNPALFARRVLEKIREQFDIFSLEGLPQVEFVPINTQSILLGTGSRK